MESQQSDIKFRWKNLIKAYWFLLGNKKRQFLFWEIILFIIHFYVVIPPLLIGKIVDFFISYKEGQSLFLFYFYTSLLGISFSLVSFIRLSLKNILGNLMSDINYLIKVNGFEKLLDFSLHWHDKDLAGNKSQRIQNGVLAFSDLSHIINNEIVRSVTTFIGIILVFIFLKPLYIIFFVIYVAGFFIILQHYYEQIQKANDEALESIEKAGGSYVEGLSNILTIKTLGASKGFKSQIAQREELTKRYEYLIRGLHNNLWKTYQIFNGLCYGIFLILVGHDVIGKTISAGSIVIFYGYLQSLTGSTNELIQIYENVIKSAAGITRLIPIFWTKIHGNEGYLEFPKNWKSISIQKGNFNYKNNNIQTNIDDNNLSEINLTISKFQKIGIVGKTGSGKSTIAKLLIGLYQFNSGNYNIEDKNFYDIRHEEILKNISLVLQDPEMFNLSLKENITLMREGPAAVLQNSITISQLEKVVSKLPEGLDTVIGEKGYRLSGGERQRIGIARAIYKNPQIMILDEATSSLDNKTEQSLQKALETNLKQKTLIIIAHRISTLQNVDRIYVFDEGKIIEQGTFKELISNQKSHFSQIYNLQNK